MRYTHAGKAPMEGARMARNLSPSQGFNSINKADFKHEFEIIDDNTSKRPIPGHTLDMF